MKETYTHELLNLLSACEGERFTVRQTQLKRRNPISAKHLPILPKNCEKPLAFLFLFDIPIY